MDHLLAVFFSVIFAHPAAHSAAAPPPAELRTFASHYSVAAVSFSHGALPEAVNRHAASYAVSSVGRLHP